ncbi:MAG: ATP-binding protein [Pseudomonadota bacterium]
MGLYHLFLYFRLPVKRANLLYFFFSLTSSYFMVSLGLKTVEWFSSPILVIRLHALAGIATIMLLHVYCLIATKRSYRRFDYGLFALNALVFLAILVPGNYHRVYGIFNGWYPIVLVSLVYLATISIQAVHHGRRDLLFLASALVFGFGTAFLDVLYGLGIVKFGQVSAVGFFVLNLGIMFSLAYEFTGAYLNVEQKVADRTQDLAIANEHLRDLEKMKAKFFTNVSHDFKTPLAIAFSHIEEARRQASEAIRAPLEGAGNALNKLLGMVTDLLDTMRADSGALKLRWETASPADLVRVWASSYNSLCAQKGLALDVQIDVPDTLRIPLDVAKIERVFANLMSNAIKFTDSGSIRVRVRSNAANIHFEISDSGPGIPKEERERIFDRFYQGFNTALRDHGGSGIGLSFVKDVVDAHSGRVWVDEAKPSGSTFTVALPIAQDVEITGEHRISGDDLRLIPPKGSVDVPYPPSEPPIVDPKRPKVLVVEDNPEIAQALFNSLRNDFVLYFAPNGAEAIKILGRTRPDGILTDLMMPVMDGTELLKKLRSEPKWKGIPVVILSSKGEDDDIVEHLKLGAQDYVSKPFRRDVLIARLSAQIERRRLFERLLNADKMVTMGLLSSGISHELRNPLGQAQTSVAFVTATVRAAPETPPKLVAAAELAERAITRMRGIVESMRGFASGSQQRGELNLKELIEEAVTLVAGKAKKRGAQVTVMRADPVKLLGYSTLHQVLVNLLDNAIDACEEFKGEIGISCEQTNDGSRITVKDNGSGIRPDVLPHIFDPYMTTKPPDQGTGLGLFIVRQIVELQHGGKISVDSTIGRGALFSVELPAEAPVMEVEGVKLFHGYDLGVS